MASILDSDMSKGIGQLLREKRIQVPFYQRDYSWKKSQVEELYDDLRKAIDDHRDYYFLGSIVGCQNHPKSDEVEIVDGQQRLASTYILLSAMRDKLVELQERELADRFEEQHLFHERGLRDPVRHPGIRLNETDDVFFQRRIASRSKQQYKRSDLRVASHKLIDDAAKCAAYRVKEIVGNRPPSDQKGELDKWVDFIQNKARVIFIVVDDPADAFMIFETLNDRGLDLSVADLTKNYLFMKVGKDCLEAAKVCWSRMVATLTTTSESEVTKVYIHHLWSSYNGVSRDKELFREMRLKYDNSQKAMQFTQLLSEKSSVYAALANSDSDFWNTNGGRHAKRHLAILNSSLKVSQVRMLLLAVVDHFTADDVGVALQCCVWWSVRFLIAGGSPSKWEAHYANRAKAIRVGRIKNAQELIDDMVSDVPADDIFKAAFAEAETGKAIGRYFLWCFEDLKNDKPFPHLAQDDPKIADREHIMPASLDKDLWPNLTKEDHERLSERIGNHALLTPTENKARKTSNFKEAKIMYANSNHHLTKSIAAHESDEWNEDSIAERQKMMAELAAQIWPAKPPELAKKKKRK